MLDILLVDDDELVLQSFGLLLQREGFAVTQAASGEAAVERAAEQLFDLVITDIKMPGMDGIETIRVLRNSLPEAHIIVLTGYASEDSPVEALRLGVDDYLLKPFDLVQFLERIREICRHRRRAPKHHPRQVLTQLFDRLRERLPVWAARAEDLEKLVSRQARELELGPTDTQALRFAPLLTDLIGPNEEPKSAADEEPEELLDTIADLLAQMASGQPKDAAAKLLLEASQSNAGPPRATTKSKDQVTHPFRILSLGRARVEIDGVPIPDKAWESSRARWLFFFLLLRRGQRIPQERLWDLFWPQSTSAKARRALLSTIHRARKAIPIEDVVLRTERSYAFNRELDFWWDLDLLEQAMREAKSCEKSGDVTGAIRAYSEMADLYRGPLLPECVEEWAYSARDTLQQKVVQCLCGLARLQLAKLPAEAERTARRILALEATTEPAYALLITALGAQGRRDEAVRVYEQCEKVLQEHLDLGCGQEVREALRNIS